MIKNENIMKIITDDKIIFDLFKKEICDNVMFPQISKPNNAYYQKMRQTQAEAILNKYSKKYQSIWTKAKCDVVGVNTDIIKTQRKFAIKVIFDDLTELIFEIGG
jgi:hypothetical protein